MLKNNFNKFWGTEFRVSNIIETIFQYFQHIDDKFESSNLLENVNEETLKEWNNEISAYRYDKSLILKNNYYSMIISNVKKLVGTTLLKQEFKNMDLIDFKNKIIFNLQKTNEPISLVVKEIFDFYDYMNTQNKVIDAKLFQLIILIVDIKSKESIKDLYFKYENNIEGVVQEIATTIVDEEVYFNVFNKIKESKPIEIRDLNYRKEPNIFGQILQALELFKQETEDEVYVDSAEVIALLEVYNENKKFRELLGAKTNLKKFLFAIQYSRLEKLFLKDYLDVNSRVLVALGLIIKTDEFNPNDILTDFNFNNEEKVYILKTKKHQHSDYPLSKEEVVDYLQNYEYNEIKRDLADKKFNKYSFLKSTKISTIIEYLINLYNAYKFNIKPNDFRNYSNTILEEKTLLPLTHAPGGRADMFFYENYNLYCFETTIINNLYSLLKKEVFQSFDHAIKHSEDIEENFDNIKIKLYIPKYNEKDKEFINNIFSILKPVWENEYKKIIEIKLINFNEIEKEDA